MATNWVDKQLTKTKKTGPTPMPHPGDPGYSLNEIRQRQSAGYRPPVATGKPGSGIDSSDRMKIAGGTHDITTPASPVAGLPVIDPLGDLNEIYKQLLNSLSQSNTVLSDKQIRKLAEDQIKMQFDPQIKALKQDMAERKQRYAANKAEVQDLYSDLANQYRSERGNSVNAYNDAQAYNDSLRTNTDAQMQQNFQNSLDYQTNEFNKLGIGDVAQTNYPQQQQDLQYQQTLNNAEADAFDRYLAGGEASAQDFYSKMAANAGYHGAETIEDLLAELNSNLDNSSSQITQLRGQSGTALSTLIAQLQQQQQQRLAEAQQQQFQNLLNAGNFGKGIAELNLQMQKAATGGQNQKVPTSGLLGATQQFANLPDPQKMLGVFQQLLSTQPFLENNVMSKGGESIKLSAPQAAQYAVQMAQQMGLSQQETAALYNAVFAYFGQLGR
jgi:HD-GYP domain-containing protein (c-di-GMP phosphodiesterase class II)